MRFGSMLALILLTILAACVSLPTQRQKIAAACESSASAADAIAIATTAGRVSKAKAQEALKVYKTTVPFCQPEPVEKLSDVDYRALLSSAASLTLTAESAR